MTATDARPRSPQSAPAPPPRLSSGKVPKRRRARWNGTRANWRSTGLVTGAMLSALGSLHVLLRDISWFVFPAFFTIVVLVAAAIARGFVRSRILPTVIAAAAGLLALTFGYAAESAILGIFPTPASFARFDELRLAGLDSIVEQAVRATPELGIVFLLSILMMALALSADLAVTAHMPALTFVPLAVILAIPPIVDPGLSDALWYIAAAGFYLAILRLGARPSSVRATLATGAVIVLGSLLGPFLIPGVDTEDAPNVAGVQAGVNPLVNLGDDLRRGDIVLALQYQTSNTLGVYLRLATLDEFNGRLWTPNMIPATPDNRVDEFPEPQGLADRVDREQEWADVTVHDISGRWLPVPYPATSVTGLDGGWYWDETGLSVRSPDTGVRGQKYRAEFLDLEPTLEQLQAVGPAPEGTESTYLELPREMPPIIAETAQAVAGQFASSYDRAFALQNYFQSGEFEYSEDAPVRDGYDGTGTDVIGEFLEKKVGYCVHYASAMAVMARTLGIPSRIAVGFTPGERAFDKGQTTYSVYSDDLHAWPELYFEGVGWLRFEPTPGRGTVPEWGTQAVDDPTTPQNEATPVPTVTPGAVAPERPDTDLGATPDSEAEQGTSPAPFIVGGVLLAIVLVLLTPAAFRAGVRLRRYRAMQEGTDAASAAWAELRDTARDHGWSAPDSETPRAFEERLAMVLTADREPLSKLRGDVEESAYARQQTPTISVAELREVRAAIARSTPMKERIRIALLPPSLVARVRGSDE